MKYEIGEPVFYMDNNRIFSAKITARMCIENEKDKAAKVFGDDVIQYHLGKNGTRNEEELFSSKEDLLQWLDDNSAILE
jgi:hypothetical protein